LGIDASARNIGTAAAHAEGANLPLTYKTAAPEELSAEPQTFDVVLNMEVVEHVADTSAFLSACASRVAPGGFMIVATINRTLKSLALAKFGAEYVLRWLPAGTHDWNRFIAPANLTAMLADVGLHPAPPQGVAFDPIRWEWHLSEDTDVNYMIVAEK